TSDVSSCLGLQYLSAPVQQLVNLESTAINADRSFRVAVVYTVEGCDSRAITTVAIDQDNHEVFLQPSVFREFGEECPAVTIPDTRFVTLRLGAGQWTIYGLDGAGQRVELQIDIA